MGCFEALNPNSHFHMLHDYLNKKFFIFLAKCKIFSLRQVDIYVSGHQIGNIRPVWISFTEMQLSYGTTFEKCKFLALHSDSKQIWEMPYSYEEKHVWIVPKNENQHSHSAKFQKCLLNKHRAKSMWRMNQHNWV